MVEEINIFQVIVVQVICREKTCRKIKNYKGIILVYDLYLRKPFDGTKTFFPKARLGIFQF